MKIMRHQLELIGDAADGSDYIARGFGWLVVFYVPSTAMSLRDNPIYWKSVLHRSQRESNPGPSRGSPLHYRCATPAPLTRGFNMVVILGPYMCVHDVM